MRDHQPLVIGTFRGTFDRGEEESAPLGYFSDSRNVRFLHKGVATRYGSANSITIASVKRMAAYERVGEAHRLLILDASGNLYDSTNLSTPILSIAAMSDFSMVSIFSRAYITPHNGITGLPGEKVYIYSGSGLARAAAGLPPSAFTLGLADSAASGTVEVGTRVFAVAYQTDTGFITAPGGFRAFTSVGGRKVDLSALPIGPTGTAARVILATKAIVNFTGDFASQTYYYVPDGTLANNTGATLTVDFYDADLQDDASPLLENLSEIPAGVCISLVQGRMVVGGEDANSSIARVSLSGEPEAHNGADGYITVNPGDSGGGIKNCTEYRTALMLAKSQRFYGVQIVDELSPSEWKPIQVDAAVGADCHCFGKSMNFGENIEDKLFVADRSGLRLYIGTFLQENTLTFNVDDIWGRINKAYFHTVELAIDPINFYIYVAIPLDAATTPNYVLFGDYSEGIEESAIRWTLWNFASVNPTTIVVDVEASIPIFKFGYVGGNVRKLDTTSLLDYGNAIDSYVKLPHLPQGNELDDSVNHFTGARLRVKGAGSLQITGEGLDGSNPFTALPVTLGATPGRIPFAGFNFVSERCALKLRVNATSEWFNLSKVSLQVTPLWEERSN